MITIIQFNNRIDSICKQSGEKMSECIFELQGINNGETKQWGITIYIDNKESKRRLTIGRKQGCDFTQEEDQHLSNIHAVISYNNGFYLEDLASTNGTWIRLIPGQEYSLQDKDEFRVGAASNIFQVNLVQDQTMCMVNLPSHNEDTKCFICLDREKNCIYFPCRHQVSCMDCAKKTSECPICKQSVHDFVRIYTA